jgi:ABC-type transport system involved in multi-copper enzyme maturation permease subunit
MSNVRSLAAPGRGRLAAPAWASRWRVVRQVAAQELREALLSWPWYVTAAAGLLLAVLLIYNSLSFVASSKLLIMSRPFYLPLLVVATLAMLYIMAWSILAIARPRDQGALRVLFFAPVDPAGLLAGHLLAGLAIYSLLVLLTLPLLVALALLTNLPFPPLLVIGAAVSPLFALVAVAIGLFISSVAHSSRSAMFVFVAVVLLVLGIQGGYRALLSVPPTSAYYDALLFARALLRAISGALDWVSPMALLSAGLDAALRGSWPDLLLRAAAALAGGGAWLWLAVWGFERRGVLP